MLIAFKLKLALACAAGLAGPLAVAPLVSDTVARNHGPAAEQTMIELQPGHMPYRLAGDFTRAGQQAEAPLAVLRFAAPLSIMKHQVSASDYQHCVDEGACRPLAHGVAATADRPVVQVSWHDANAYADWLSRISGDHYRLPTDEEWAFAAGARFKDDGLPVDALDPSKRWISRYERESDRAADDTTAHAFGSFGVNENGLLDVAGNVWEWTSTCFVRSELDRADRTMHSNVNCGVRVAEGAHRAYVTDFIRDARAGGCAQGVPPSNLGFRLVRGERSWIAGVASSFNRALRIARS